MKNMTFFLLFLLLPVLAAAQTYTVEGIEIEGNRRVEQTAILSVVDAAPGQVSMETIDRDIRAIFRMGRFEDVAADIEQRNGRTTLIYRVDEYPLVRRVTFSGNKEISEETGLAQGAVGTTLARARKRLVDAFETMERDHAARS